MQTLHDIGLQQVLTYVQPRVHEDIVHLVSRRFHRLMLRSVDLNLRFTVNMHPGMNYITSLITSLESIRKIHMLNLSSELATGHEANRVLARFAFPVLHQAQHDNKEVIFIPLKILSLELCNAGELPVNTWNISTLQNLRIYKCLRITEIAAALDGLQNLTSLHVDKCRRLHVMPNLPPNLQTFTISSCPSVAMLPLNLNAVSSLRTLKFSKLAIRALPDIHLLTQLICLVLEHCVVLTTVGRVPGSIEELSIEDCVVLTEIEENNEFPNLRTLTLVSLPGLEHFDQWVESLNLRVLNIDNCRKLRQPENLPTSLESLRVLESRFSFTDCNMLSELRSLELVNFLHNQWSCPDISELRKLDSLILSGNQTLNVNLPTSIQKLSICYKTHDRFRGFPENILQMRQITHLYLENYALDDQSMTVLREMATACRVHNGTGWVVLSLKNCGLVSVPAWIGENTGLEKLDLTHNNIREFPVEFSNLVRLHSFSSGNDIHVHLQNGRHNPATRRPFPPFIYNLPRLQTLELFTFFEHTTRKVHPVEIHLDRLTRLTHLNLSGNALRTV